MTQVREKNTMWKTTSKAHVHHVHLLRLHSFSAIRVPHRSLEKVALQPHTSMELTAVTYVQVSQTRESEGWQETETLSPSVLTQKGHTLSFGAQLPTGMSIIILCAWVSCLVDGIPAWMPCCLPKLMSREADLRQRR